MKYFVVSDTHSFNKSLRAALKQAGFDKKNKNHALIVCGDVFDRGENAVGVYNFINSVPKSRRVLIRGNHESLYLSLLKKDFPQGHDFHNCTVDTFCQIADMEYIDEDIKTSDFLDDCGNDPDGLADAKLVWHDVVNRVKNSKITKWIMSDEWKDYYELGKYIFVHSFLPTEPTKEALLAFGINAYGFENPHYLKVPRDWREHGDWEKAVWGCPWAQFKEGLFRSEARKGKVLVCGHWHTGDFFKHLKNFRTREHDGEIYYSRHLIAIDGGTSYDFYFDEMLHDQNVLVIDEAGVCWDKYGNKLRECKDYFATHKRIETVTVE